jgi:acyl-coenzyme A thioesterase PaaI-like protein
MCILGVTIGRTSLPSTFLKSYATSAVYKRRLSLSSSRSITCTRVAFFHSPEPRIAGKLISSYRHAYSTVRIETTATNSAGSFYSRFSSAVEEATYLKPRAWLLSAILLSALSATLAAMSVQGFIAYTDEESLKIYQPSEPKQVEIEEYISNHPLTQSLRSNSAFSESRPTMKIKEEYRHASLTSGVLAGPGRIEVPPYSWSEEGGKSLVSIMYLGEELCGYPGVVHGGLLATLLDEGLARCCFPALPNKLGMTASLTVNYRKPSMAQQYIVLKGKTVKVEGRKAWVEGHIETLPQNGEEPVVLVEASALMIEPKQAKVRSLCSCHLFGY